MKQENSLLRAAGFCLVALLLLIVFCSPLLAQLDISAQVVGTVTDPSGAVVPGAHVVARNQLTGVGTKITSDERGNFIFPSLSTGAYTVSCELTGFQTFVTSDIVLQAGKIVTLPITLQVGTTKQTVQVTAAAAMVDTTTATIRTTFDVRILDATPLWGRDPRETMELLMPGAVPGGVDVASEIPITSFNGVAGYNNNYRIDGSEVVDYYHSGPFPTPPIEDLQEFSVTTSVSDASTARGAGGQIESVIKNGTNDLHGQFWGYFQNAAWNANPWQNNWLGVAKLPFSQHWLGGNAGGPVFIPKLYNGKNKTFFFVSYERNTTAGANLSTLGTISLAERAGDFTNSPDGIPVINGVPTPIISPTSFSTMGKFLAANPNVLPNPTSGVDTFAWSPTYSVVNEDFIGRIDENFGEKNRLFGSLWWSRSTPTFQDEWYFNGDDPGHSNFPNNFLWGFPTWAQVWTANDTWTISPTMVNNAIFSVRRLFEAVDNQYNQSTSSFNDSNLGIGAVADVLSPQVQQINVPRFVGIGMWNGYKQPLTQNGWSFSDNFTAITGRHTIKAGMEFRQFHSDMYQTWGSGADINFSDANINVGGSGNAIADMLLGLAPNFWQNNTQQSYLTYPAIEAYVQDTFKASRRVTIMYGVRWQPYFGVRADANDMSTFVPGEASTGFPTAPVGLVVPGDQGIPRNLTGDKFGDLGPRASVAWDIFGNGKASFRAGYGLMNTYQNLWLFYPYSNSSPWGVSYGPNPAKENLVNPYAQYGSVPFPWTIPKAGAPTNSSITYPPNLNIYSKARNYNNGTVQQWNFTFEFEPVKTYLVSVGYVGTRGTHLEEQSDFNFPRFVPGASTNDFDNIQSRRPWGPTFQTITQDNTDYNSLYSALQLRFDKKYSYGLAFMGNYTLSSTKQVTTYAMNNMSAGSHNGVRDPADWALDYFSPGIMHHFAMAFSYGLPIPTGPKRVFKALFGGWTIGGNVTGSSGNYGAVYDYNCAAFNYGSANCVATFTGGSPYSPSLGQPQMSSGAQIGVSYLNPSKFLHPDQILVGGVPTTSPDLGQRLFLGNAVAGTYKGPAMFMLNAMLSKDFALTERLKFQYRIEAQNVLNHTVLNQPDPVYTEVQPDMSHFGTIDTAMNPRMIQMSARFIF